MFENVALALQGIWSHKLRSMLTMLGIIIGIASIITIVSTIKGTNEQIKENLIGQGTNAVEIKLYQDEYEYDLSYSPVPDGIMPIGNETLEQLKALNDVEDVSLYRSRRYVDGTVYYKNTGFSGDLYGKEIRVFFYKKLRDEVKFPSLAALQAEIRRNADETRAYFAK